MNGAEIYVFYVMGGRSCDRYVMFVVAPSGSMLRKEATVPKTSRVQLHPTYNSPQPLIPIIQPLPNPIRLSNPRARIPIHNLMPLLTPTLHLDRHRRLRRGGVVRLGWQGRRTGRCGRHLGRRDAVVPPRDKVLALLAVNKNLVPVMTTSRPPQLNPGEVPGMAHP